ncbi:peptidoglycan editing factor PgeF [Candidatus Dependentiae bacterium]|nr:peptidoglycan editing factor PgeF [Candidatus Dependentiae bacterium]
MIIHQQGGLCIFFGDAFSCSTSPKDAQFGFFCQSLCSQLPARSLVVLKQVHGVAGQFIDKINNEIEIFEHEGDYLTTNQPEVALGVLTADCLPVVMYDPVNHAIAVVHAGWRGSVARIAAYALESLVRNVGTQPSDLQVFFGPAAKVCCYEVQEDFCDLVKDNHLASGALIKRNGKVYFDKVLFNKSLLIELGVKPENINQQYNQCTMCTQGFHSHRRSGGLAGRQLTCALLTDIE